VKNPVPLTLCSRLNVRFFSSLHNRLSLELPAVASPIRLNEISSKELTLATQYSSLKNAALQFAIAFPVILAYYRSTSYHHHHAILSAEER
jgi:hypothetical protein